MKTDISAVSDIAKSVSEGETLIVEAAAGAARRRWIEQFLKNAACSGRRVFLLDCDFDSGGPWAGVGPLFSALLEQIQQQRHDMIERHLYELMHACPRLRHTHSVRNPTLTDLSPPEERVRNYPADRALRNQSSRSE